MYRNSILCTGALAALLAPHGSSPALVVNDSLIPRFTGAGRLVAPGELFNPEELDTADFIAKSQPVGTLTDDQLLALVAQRNLTPNPGAPESEPGAAPVAPVTSQAALDDLDELRSEQREDLTDVARASDVISPPDRDGDGKPGGSLKKAEIEAELTALGIEYDKSASRDDLGRLLDAELAKTAPGA